MSEGGPRAAETIGARLRRLRRERGLSQRDIASPGVSYAYISRIEAEARRPSVKALRLLAQKLGVSAEYLETGREMSASEDRELLLADAELALRLEEGEEQAEQALRDVLEEAGAAGDSLTAARARIALGLNAARNGRNAVAVEELEAAVETAAVTPVSRPDVYAALGRAYAALGTTGRAIALFERCLGEVKEQTPENFPARAWFASYLSYALADTGELGAASAVIAEALEDVEAAADPYTRVRLYWSMARLATFQGESPQALDYARRAISLLQTTEDTVQLGRAHLLAASIMNLQEDAAGAQAQLEMAERLLGTRPPRDDLAALRSEQAKAAAVLGNADEAIALGEEALEIAGDENLAELGGTLWALGEARGLKGETEAADEAFRRSVEVLSGDGQWREAAQACRAWARFLRREGRDAEAFEALERAAELGIRTAPADAPSSPSR